MAVTASDRFNAKVDTYLEAGVAKNDRGVVAGASDRAKAVRRVIAEHPQLHADYVAEYQAKQNHRQFRR